MRLRTVIWLLAAMLMLPLVAAAQTTTPTEVKPGVTVMLFDHSVEQQAITTGYKVCQDTLTACMPVTVTRIGTTPTLSFVLPATAARGDHVYRMVAFNADGDSEPSVAASFRVRVVPGQPGPLRVQS